MKTAITILAILMMFLTACSSPTLVVEQQPNQTAVQPVQQEQRPDINVSLTPEFKITAQQAIRNPPTIIGSFKNVGLGGSAATVTARVYYASVVASEKTQKFDYIGSEEEANFTFSFDKTTQWTSYSVSIEPN